MLINGCTESCQNDTNPRAPDPPVLPHKEACAQISRSLFSPRALVMENLARAMFAAEIWTGVPVETITGFDAEACWPLNGPLFSPLNPLYSFMGIGVTPDRR